MARKAGKCCQKKTPKMGETLSTFTFLLFGLFLGLAALAEVNFLKAATLWACTVLSMAGALRYVINKLWKHYQHHTKRRR